MGSRRAYSAAAVIATLLVACPSAAEDPVPRIEVLPSATVVGTGEVFNLIVRVVTEDTSVESVTLPDLSAFEVLGQSVSNPVQVSFGFGSGGSGMQTTHTREYDIWLKSKKPGKVTLSEVLVKWKGKTYKGRPVVVTVTSQPPKQTSIPTPKSPFDDDWPFKMPGFPQPGIPQPMVPEPVAPAPDAGAGDDPVEAILEVTSLEGAQFDSKMFIQTLVEPPEVVIGQQVTLTLLLWSADSMVGSIEIPTEPGTDGFWVKDLLPPAAKVNFTPRIASGQTFQVAVLRKLALFPTEAGTLTISPAVVKTSAPFVGLLGGGSYTRTGVPVTVEVSGLPAQGKPEGFLGSSVGSYKLSATLAPQATDVDQPVTYTLTLQGTGNIEMLAAPKLEFPDGVKAYEPQVTDLVTLTGGMVGGTKKIEYLIMPSRPGKVSVGPVQWPFFDPASSGYRVLRAPTVVLTVNAVGGNEAQEATTQQGSAIQPQDAEDRLRPIRTVAALQKSRAQMVRTPWFFASVVFPPGLLAILYLVVLGRTVARGVSLRNPAGRAFRESTAMLRRVGQSGDHGEFYAGIQRVIYTYLERRFGIPATGMTGPELMRALVDAGVTAEAAEAVVKETENCEFARYGRSSSERNLDMAVVRARVLDTLAALERFEPRRGKAAGRGEAS